jgi:uncharacterized glyoxalase superfamily protein PhnB
MTFRDLTISLETNDLNSTIAFYKDKLGFTLRGSYPDENPSWAGMDNGTIVIMFSERNAHSHQMETAFTGSLYFYSENIDEVWEALKDVTTVEYPIENFDYGMREFAVYDPNGYLLRFGQEVETLS